MENLREKYYFAPVTKPRVADALILEWYNDSNEPASRHRSHVRPPID